MEFKNKKRTFTILFGILLISSFFYYFWVQTQQQTRIYFSLKPTESITSSSIIAPVCSSIFKIDNEERRLFDISLFNKRVSEWRKDSSIADLNFSELKPEEFLAFLEVSSRRGEFEGLNLETWFISASNKEIDNVFKVVNQTISKINKSRTTEAKGQITEHQLKKLLINLYKISQMQKFSLWNLSDNLDFKNALQNLRDDFIANYIQKKLTETNILEAFYSLGLLRNPSKIERFRSYLNKKKGVIWKTLTVISTAATFANHNILPILPEPDFIGNFIKKNPQIINEIFRNGIRTVMPQLLITLKDPLHYQIISHYAIKSFNTISVLLLISFLIQETQDTIEKQKKSQLLALEKFNAIIDNINQIAEAPELSPEEFTNQLLQDFVKDQEKHGNKIDTDSDEFRALQKLMNENN